MTTIAKNDFQSRNPWPPSQFVDIPSRDEMFCTWCGHYFPKWVAPTFKPGEPTCDVMIGNFHDCVAYGKHCRHKGLSADTYYMRVTSFGSSGRHHYDSRKSQLVGVKDLVTQEISFKMIESIESDLTSTWKHRAALDDSHYFGDLDEDNLDDCVCYCNDCLPDGDNETFHCGDDLLGCHEKKWELPSLDDCLCDCDDCEPDEDKEVFHCGDDLLGCHEKKPNLLPRYQFEKAVGTIEFWVPELKPSLWQRFTDWLRS